MELYILDSTYRRIQVIDRFESLIWTERFQSYGDFELTMYSTREAQSLLTYNTKVAINKSNRVMIIDEIENKTDSDGKKILSIKGSSIEKILQDRVASDSLSNLTEVLKGVTTVSTSTDTVTCMSHGLITGDLVHIKSTGNFPKYFKASIQGVSNIKNTFRIDKHGFNTGDTVMLATTGSLPSPLQADTIYYVISVNTNMFKLALTFNDANDEVFIDLTDSGSGTINVFSTFDHNNNYYAIVTSDNDFKLAFTYDDAILGTYLNFGGSQSGTHTLYWVNGGKWRVKGTPLEILNGIFQSFCVTGKLQSTDVIPSYSAGTLYPADTIPYPSTSMVIDIQITSVYDIIKQLCELHSLGFRMTRNKDLNQIFFNIYSGNIKTTTQTVFNPIVFDPSLETLTSDTEYTSIKNLKNVAYVFSKNGYATVYSNSASSITSGFDKHVLFVDASDIDVTDGAVLQTRLEQRGQEELLKYRTINAFDGEVPQYSNFIYDVDYSLGDIVEVRNKDGYGSAKRVTEQIFVDDIQGEKSYPTLSSELVVTPDSWLSWSSTLTWSEVPNDLDHEWQDL